MITSNFDISHSAPVKTFWMPPGDTAFTRLGLVEVGANEVLWPEDHYWKAVGHLQAKIIKSRISRAGLDNLLYANLESRGFLIGFRTMKQAGEDIIDWLLDNLHAVGALITEPIYIEAGPIEVTPYQPMSLQEWIETAGRMLPPKVG